MVSPRLRREETRALLQLRNNFVEVSALPGKGTPSGGCGDAWLHAPERYSAIPDGVHLIGFRIIIMDVLK